MLLFNEAVFRPNKKDLQCDICQKNRIQNLNKSEQKIIFCGDYHPNHYRGRPDHLFIPTQVWTKRSSLHFLLQKRSSISERPFSGEYRIRTDHLFTASEAL